MEQQTEINDNENFQVATLSTASIKATKSSSGDSMPPTSVDKLLSDFHTDSEKKAQVKKIMQSVRSKLDGMPSTKLTEIFRSKIDMLDKDRKEMVGVFGKTGAGKSSLINAILGEKKLLPSGNQGACTSVMIQVEANMTNEKYIAEIEFITVQDWNDELNSMLHEDDDKIDNKKMDDEKIEALYGTEGCGKTIGELKGMLFSEIPEFYLSHKKCFICNTAEDISKKIACYILSDSNGDLFERRFWPLVKCLTIKVPKSEDLLEHVVLVDLPGNGDCNKTRDTMWRSFVGNCSAVWIVSDISRAISEKEPWEILDSTVGLFGPGGECRSISFICTKTDNIDEGQKDDAHSRILSRNERTKKNVRLKFHKMKYVTKHFSDADRIFKVFTVSSKKYNMEKQSEPDKKAMTEQSMNTLDTEIPHLQEFLRNLNDHRTRTSDYIFSASRILSLIQAARNSDMKMSKEEVHRILDPRLNEILESIGQCMEKTYNIFDQCLSQGVQQSDKSCQKLMNEVIEPHGVSGSGYHVVVKLLCENDGIYKPKRKSNNTQEMNLNKTLASCMNHSIAEEFTNVFPNDKCGPITEQIENFTLDSNSLAKKHKSLSMALHKTEKELKTELIRDLLERKKQIYHVLTKSIKDSMHVSYKRASGYRGKGSLKMMKDDLRQHLREANIFQKAKKDMLDCLTNLKDHIVKQLNCNLQESIEISLQTTNSSLLPDVTTDYNKIKELMLCSSTIPVNVNTGFQKDVKGPRSVTSQHIRRSTYSFQCDLTGLVFEMASKGDVCCKMSQWDTSLLGSMTPAGPLFSIDCPAILHLHLPHCMCEDTDEVLSVAHFTGGKMEIVKPLKTTASHVVVNISNPSLVGLIRHGSSTRPVQSQVLMFLGQGDTNQKGILNVFLLPKNVPKCEVEHQQNGSTFIQTNSECTLSPGRRYGLHGKLVDCNIIQNVQFDSDYTRQLLPTFEVDLNVISDVKNMNLTLLDRDANDHKVWEYVVKYIYVTSPSVQANPTGPLERSMSPVNVRFI